MKIPSNMTEDEVLQSIDNVANRLAHKFRFGYHGIDDMKQQARMYAIEALNTGKYDEKRVLDNFLYTCVRNALFNDKRDKYERPDKPCFKCPINAYVKYCDGCTEFSDKLNCSLYASWYNRNFAKRNIMAPITIDNVNDERENNMKTSDDVPDIAMKSEIVSLLDKYIPHELRHFWIKSLNGVKISKPHREKLQEAIHNILKEHNINVEEAW